MTNKDLFKQTYDKIHLSNESIEELKQLKSYKRSSLKRFAQTAVAAVFAITLIFVSGTAIVYATAPEIVSNIANTVKGFFYSINNGDNDVSYTENFSSENNTLHYSIIDADEGYSSNASITFNNVVHEHFSYIIIDKDIEDRRETYIILLEGTLKTSDECILLDICHPGEKTLESFDITDDFSDGAASGEFTIYWLKDFSFRYTVEGSFEEYTVTFEIVEE